METHSITPTRPPGEAKAIRKMIGEPEAGLTGFGEWIQEIGKQNPQFDVRRFNGEISAGVSRYRQVVVKAMGLPERLGDNDTDLAVMKIRSESGSVLKVKEEEVGTALTPAEVNLIKNAFQEVMRFVESQDNIQGGKLADITQKGATLSLAIDAAAFGLSFSRNIAPLLAKMKEPKSLLSDLGMRDYLDIMRNKKWTEATPANWGSKFKGDREHLETSATLMHLGRGGRSWLNHRIDGYLEAIRPLETVDIDVESLKRNQLGRKLKVEALARIFGEGDRIELLGDQEYLELVRELTGTLGQPELTETGPIDQSSLDTAAASLQQETERLLQLGSDNHNRSEAIPGAIAALHAQIEALTAEATGLEARSPQIAQALGKLEEVQAQVQKAQSDSEREAVVIALRSEFFGITADEAGKLWPHIEDLFRLDPAVISGAEHIEFLLSKIPLFNKVYPKLESVHTTALSSALNTVQGMLGLGIPIDQARGSLEVVMARLRSQLGEEAVKAGQATLDKLKFPEVVISKEAVVAQIKKILQETASVK